MGASDVVPGVSGGTMALILGIYEELIRSIKAIDFTVIKLLLSFKIKEALDIVPWKFLLAVLGGILLAVFSLAQAIEWTLENQPVLIWSFFFGLVLASVLMVSKRIKSGRRERWQPLLRPHWRLTLLWGWFPRKRLTRCGLCF
jgi:putative membrane protein